MKRTELQRDIVKKAIADESFKAEFLKDPKGSIEKEFGFKVPEGVAVDVVEEDASTLTIILPKNTGELTDGELDNVAGGWCVHVDCDFCPKDFDVF